MKWILLIGLIWIGSCKDSSPTKPEYSNSITLTLADTFCTESYLNIALGDTKELRSVLLTRNGVTVWQGTLFANAPTSSPSSTKLDTTIVDTGLAPNTPYSYRAYRLDGNTRLDSSLLNIKTMDTTSHNWTWTIKTFGDFASSSLYDVAIINDTLAYAVGEIYLRDSLGQNDPILYNLAIWNGQQWRFEKRGFNFRLLYPNGGGSGFSIRPIRSIFAFSPNDIWIAAGTVQHWNGINWTEYAAIVGYDNQGFPIAAGGALKIWGSSSSNLYFVGRDGLIIHYDGVTWNRIESGTDLNIYDIYGDGNEVLAVGSELTPQRQENILIRISPTPQQYFSTSPIQFDLQTIWFVPNRLYLVAGSGIFQKHKLNEAYWRNRNLQFTTYYTTCIRGNGVNDILTVGAFGECLHFNGISWQSLRNQTGLNSGAYGRINLRENLMMATGLQGAKAVILTGRR